VRRTVRTIHDGIILRAVITVKILYRPEIGCRLLCKQYGLYKKKQYEDGFFHL